MFISCGKSKKNSKLTPTEYSSVDLDQICLTIVAGMKKKGINLFCIDFDNTIIDKHTGGVFKVT